LLRTPPPLEVGTNARAHISTYCNMSRIKKRSRTPRGGGESFSVLDSALDSGRSSARNLSRKTSRTNSTTTSRSSSRVRGLDNYKDEQIARLQQRLQQVQVPWDDEQQSESRRSVCFIQC
jgi:hypothetical protein